VYLYIKNCFAWINAEALFTALNKVSNSEFNKPGCFSFNPCFIFSLFLSLAIFVSEKISSISSLISSNSSVVNFISVQLSNFKFQNLLYVISHKLLIGFNLFSKDLKYLPIIISLEISFDFSVFQSLKPQALNSNNFASFVS